MNKEVGLQGLEPNFSNEVFKESKPSASEPSASTPLAEEPSELNGNENGDTPATESSTSGGESDYIHDLTREPWEMSNSKKINSYRISKYT